MKILFTIPTLDVGGLEQVFLRMIKGLDRAKYDIEIVFLYNYGRLLKDIPSDIKWSYIFEENYFVRGYTYFYKYMPLNWLVKKMFSGDYDVIISFGEGPTTQLLSRYKGNAKTISWLHSAYNKNEFVKLYGSSSRAKRVYKSFDGVVCVSSDAEKKLKSIIPDLTTAKILINPIDTGSLVEKAKESIEGLNLNKDCINFITVGRFGKEKGYNRLLEVFSKLVNEGFDNVRLYMIGMGPEEEVYTRLIDENGLKDNVFILGYQENPMKYVDKADVYVCSSYREGFSTTVVEAIILNKLVITTDCGGMYDILGHNEYGIIVDNSVEALYEGIKNIILNRSVIDSYKYNIAKRANDFDYFKLINKIEEYIEDFVHD